MTNPVEAGRTSRDLSSTYLYPASQLENEQTEDRAEFGRAIGDHGPPTPVPMTDPIDDVTTPRGA